MIEGIKKYDATSDMTFGSEQVLGRLSRTLPQVNVQGISSRKAVKKKHGRSQRFAYQKKYENDPARNLRFILKRTTGLFWVGVRAVPICQEKNQTAFGWQSVILTERGHLTSSSCILRTAKNIDGD